MNRRFPAVAIYLIVLVIGYCLVTLSGCAKEPVDRKEEIFANTVADIVGVAVPLNKELNLTPSGGPRLYTEDSTTFYVFNHTGHDLVFEGNVFGVRFFVFDNEESTPMC